MAASLPLLPVLTPAQFWRRTTRSRWQSRFYCLNCFLHCRSGTQILQLLRITLLGITLLGITLLALLGKKPVSSVSGLLCVILGVEPLRQYYRLININMLLSTVHFILFIVTECAEAAHRTGKMVLCKRAGLVRLGNT